MSRMVYVFEGDPGDILDTVAAEAVRFASRQGTGMIVRILFNDEMIRVYRDDSVKAVVERFRAAQSAKATQPSPIHVHEWRPDGDRIVCYCGALHSEYLRTLPRRVGNGDRQPIVIRSTRPRTADEMREMWEILAQFPWPVLALDHDWEVHG